MGVTVVPGLNKSVGSLSGICSASDVDPGDYNQSSQRNPWCGGRFSKVQKKDPHAISAFGRQRSSSFGSLARHHDLRRRLARRRTNPTKSMTLFATPGGNFIDTANVYTNGSSEPFLANS